MPKGILEFNLDDSGDRESFEMAQNAYSYKGVLDDLFNFIRTKTKYYEDQTSISFEELREKLVELCNENDVEL